MRERFGKSLLIAFVLLVSAGFATAQVSNNGTLIGTVSDATGAVIAGAAVKVKDDATGSVLETKSTADGTFSLANVRPGTYTVTVLMQGFKTGEFRNVKVVVGNTTNLSAKMDVGEISSSVVVEAGTDVLQTQQTSVGSTVTGRLIREIPFTSRDTLDLATLDPGAQSTGRPRETTFNGLPQGAINITLDGLNVQANDSKSSDGFFTMIRPRIDSIEEFNITTAAQGAEQSGEGAVQIRFETKRGSNQFHGGAWWYHRNDFFNSNYYFNNLAGTPRQRLRLNQFGYSVGGPIWKDKIFFFHAFDIWKKPESLSQTRTLLTAAASTGTFTYPVTAIPAIGATNTWTTCNVGALTCTANLLAMVSGQATAVPNNTLDPMIQTYLQAINSAVGQAGVGSLADPSLFQRSYTFNNSSTGARYFPDFRFDWQITKNHSFTAIYHYQDFNSSPDLLNGRGPSYPVAPFNQINWGSQLSTRNSFSFAHRWNIGSAMSNEARFGVLSVPSNFQGDQDASTYPQFATPLGSLFARPCFATNAGCTTNAVISQPFLGYAPFTRNFAIAQLSDNFGWTRGRHTFNFGFSMSEQRGGFDNRNAAAGQVNVGISTNDPANGVFAGSATSLPGASTAQLTNARNLYSLLTGRVLSFTSTVFVNNATRQFTPGSNRIDRVRQTEFGFYGTDNYRLTNNLTLNYGLRWEYQGAGEDPDNLFYNLTGGSAGVWGVSGVGNLFAPGTLTGTATTYELQNGRPWYNKDLNNLAPSLGLAWTPNIDNKLWKTVFGEAGKTVLRGSYAISYTREGVNNWITIANGNPGSAGNLSSTATAAASVSAGQFAAGTVQFSSLNVPGVVQTPTSFGANFSPSLVNADSVNAFDENLRIPTVQSWSFGIQRELSPSMVLEVRYVGNHGTGLLRQLNLNEINIFENGFLNEFNNARNNLSICRATAGCTLRFSNQGLPGQVPLPIMTATFTGSATGSQTNTSFSSGANIGFLDAGLAGSFAGALNTLAGWTNLTSVVNPATGRNYPSNFWMVNPNARGGAFLMTNNAHSTYNALQVELRRRLSHGLQFNGSYVWSHSLTNLFADSSVSFLTYNSMRNPGRDKGASPFDLRHAFKMQFIYEMPFGAGKRWSASNGVINRMIEGWQLSSITRWQTGRVFRLDSGNGGTVNANDPGVELTGINAQQLQSMLEVRKVPGTPGQVFYFPASLISGGTANSAFIKPCSTPGGFCQRLLLYGPSFFREDMSIIKKTRITEKTNIEIRAEFLNAFNNINFLFGGTAGTSIASQTSVSSSFGRITNAYQDTSTTDDPGGRIIQFVIRINF